MTGININPAEGHITKQEFTSHIINDLKAMQSLIDNNRFEKGIVRIGAEQEFCLIDYSLRPKMMAMEMLEILNDKHFTTELAKFNLEINLDPLVLEKRCFTTLETELIRLLTKSNKTAHSLGGKIILTGILPSIRNSDINISNMTPAPRYQAMNDAVLNARGSEFEFNIRGIDELLTKHNSVLFESCNTSFQVHLQISPDEFAEQYNWAQAIAGPMLSAMTNSPILVGKRLWSETRIALFHQSTDARKSTEIQREGRPRVTFGHNWVKSSVMELFEENLSRYKILLTKPIKENSLDMVKNNKIPKLSALALHNGTIYKWNRPCYGITNGIPHLRIENRYIPSGPSIVDEVANAAFWVGVMKGMPTEYKNISEIMDFDDAKMNFINAAKSGLNTQFRWINGKRIPAHELILDELIPIAREGLKLSKVNQSDINKYLSIIEQRVKSEKTGANWMLNSFNKLKKEHSVEETTLALTEGIYTRQKMGKPVHKWNALEIDEGGGWSNKFKTVEQVMSRDLITVQPDDNIDLVANLMLWSDIHHIPVEDEEGHVVGIITSKELLKELGNILESEMSTTPVSKIMVGDITTTTPETPTAEAYLTMKNKEVGCLPVLENGILVGILTLKDYVKLVGKLITEIEKRGETNNTSK